MTPLFSATNEDITNGKQELMKVKVERLHSTKSRVASRQGPFIFDSSVSATIEDIVPLVVVVDDGVRLR